MGEPDIAMSTQETPQAAYSTGPSGAKRWWRGTLQGAAFVSLLGVVFVGGFSLQDIKAGMRQPSSLPLSLQLLPERLKLAVHTIADAQSGESDTSPYELYADTLDTVRNDYYGRVDTTKQLTYSAIRGMMGSLGDRFTRFVDPTEASQESQENAGQFVGIGAQLDENPAHQVYIVKPLPNSPAFKAHVMAGDIIVKIDNKPIVGMDVTRVVSLIHGQPHTAVTLTLLRSGVQKPITVTIIRNYVQSEVVVSQMIDQTHKIGYIALAQFTEVSDTQVDQALTQLQAQGMRALVFDLRGNPGGLVNIAQDISSRFIASGPIVWQKERGGHEYALSVEPKQHDHPQYPLAVLVNGGSASSAEITAGAIKDTHGGVLIGEKTFGKGIVQTVIPLPDGSAAIITTAHYYTPMHHDIHHKGIQPDIPITLTAADERAMNAFLIKHPTATVDLQYDPQLQKAVSHLVQEEQGGAKPRAWS